MNSFKLLAATAAIGLLSTTAVAQTTNSMGNSMGSAGHSAMSQGGMNHHAMPMHHMKGAKGMSMAKCKEMCRMMMKHHHGKSMKHHSKTMTHSM